MKSISHIKNSSSGPRMLSSHDVVRTDCNNYGFPVQAVINLIQYLLNPGLFPTDAYSCRSLNHRGGAGWDSYTKVNEDCTIRPF